MSSCDHAYGKESGAPGTSAIAWEKIAAPLLLAAVFLLYIPTTSYQFVYDDPYQILSNSHVHSWRFLPVYFTQNVWSQIPNSGTNLYRPLFLVWLRLNYALFGPESPGWHLTTVLMHVLVTGLVYLLARVLLRKPAAALVAAAVFGVHPIHVEAVAWISGVAEPLCAACVLGSLLSYLRSRNPSKNLPLWRTLSLILFAAGMLEKETAVVLPLLIVAYEYTVGRESEQPISIREICTTLAPYAGLFAAYGTLRTFAMHGPPRLGSIPLHTSLLSWPWLLWTYVGLLFWPAHLSPLYDFVYVDRTTSLRFVIPVAAIVLCLAVLWGLRKMKPRLGVFLALWFLITLAPAFAQFCLANPLENYHDRYLYVPSVSLAVLIGAVVSKVISKGLLQNRVPYGAAATLTIIWSCSTVHQLRFWESNYSLFEHASAVAPRNELATGNYAVELTNRGEYKRALELSQIMIRLHPASLPALQSAARAAFLLHDFFKAEHYYSEAVQLEPSDSMLWLKLGSSQMKLGRYSEAATSLHEAARLNPQAPLLHYSLGFALAQQHEWQAAREQFLVELQLNCDCSSDATRRALQDVDRHLADRPAPPLSPASAVR
jgi:protein O-mannosyl-transferase